MKKIALLITAVTILFSTPANAQSCYFVTVTRFNHHNSTWSFHQVYRCHK
jgi:hypothetical protein